MNRSVGCRLLLALAAIAACDGAEDARPSRAKCVRATDCSGVDTCIYGFCSPECAGDRDCPGGERCLRSSDAVACVDQTLAACDDDAACGDGAACVLGECRTRCVPEVVPCLRGQACVGSVCLSLDSRRDPGALAVADQVETGAGGGAPGAGGLSGDGGSAGAPTAGAAPTLAAICGRTRPCPEGERCHPGLLECVVPLVTYDGLGATFTRAGEASYAPEPGALAWAATNEMRWQSPDGQRAPMLLIEEPRCNLLEPPDNGTWPLQNGTLAEVPGGAPDGMAAALEFTTGLETQTAPRLTSPAQLYSPPPPALAFSLFLRAGSTSVVSIANQFGTPLTLFDVTATPSWRRVAYARRIMEATDPTFVAIGTDPPQAGADPTAFSFFGPQLEVGEFPTSYTRARCGGATRGRETLRLDDGSALTTQPFVVYLWPAAASDEAPIDGFPTVVLSFGDGVGVGDALQLDWGPLGTQVVATAAGALVAVSGDLDFGRGEELAVVVDPAAGRLVVNGREATFPPWSWPEGPVHVGSTDLPAQPFYPFTGLISEPFGTP